MIETVNLQQMIPTYRRDTDDITGAVRMASIEMVSMEQMPGGKFQITVKTVAGSEYFVTPVLPNLHIGREALEAYRARLGGEEPMYPVPDFMPRNATADADLLAAWSGGRIGWAIHMIAHPDELEARQGQLDELIAMQLQPRAAGFRWAEERAKQYRSGEQAAVFEALGLWQSWWRDVLVTAAGCPEQIIHIDRRAEIEQAAARFHLAEIERFVARLNDTARQLRENVNPQLALENALLHLPGA